MQQHVIQGLAPALGCLDEDEEILYDLGLPLEVVYTPRAQGLLYLGIFRRETFFFGIEIGIHRGENSKTDDSCNVNLAIP